MVFGAGGDEPYGEDGLVFGDQPAGDGLELGEGMGDCFGDDGDVTGDGEAWVGDGLALLGEGGDKE